MPRQPRSSTICPLATPEPKRNETKSPFLNKGGRAFSSVLVLAMIVLLTRGNSRSRVGCTPEARDRAIARAYCNRGANGVPRRAARPWFPQAPQDQISGERSHCATCLETETKLTADEP